MRRQEHPSIEQSLQFGVEFYHLILSKELRDRYSKACANSFQRWNRRCGVPAKDIHDRGFRQFGFFRKPILSPPTLFQKLS